jgi:hypothetical protein
VAAVNEALRPIAIIVSSATTGSIGQRISLSAGTSIGAGVHRLVGFQWSANPNISIANANSATAEIIFPATRPITVTLTVTDDAGRQDTSSLTIASAITGNGSGGGATSVLDLLLLALLLLVVGARPAAPAKGTETPTDCRYAMPIRS